MPTQGQITQTTENVEIYLNQLGSPLVDTLNIDVYKWDTGSNAEVLSGSIAVGITPYSNSPVNGHSLMDGYPDGGSGLGYEITGITYDCTRVAVTTAGSYGHCQGVTQYADLTHAASQIYNPSYSTWTIQYSGTSAAYPMIYTTPGFTTSTGANLGYPDSYPFAFITIPWGNEFPYSSNSPLLNVSTFSISHVSSKKVSDNSTVTGGWANGPLVNISVENSQFNNDGQHFGIKAQQRSGVTQKFPGDYIHSIYRVTWTDSGNYYDVDFYWETDTYSI
jgi:hypothetical protein